MFGWALWMVATTAVASPLPDYAKPPPPPSAQTEDPFGWRVGLQPDAVRLELQIPAAHVIYRDQVEVEVRTVEGAVLGDLVQPAGRTKPDPARPADTREVYDAPVVLTLPIEARQPEGRIDLRLRYQGCRTGLCFAPVESMQTIRWSDPVPDAEPPAEE